MMMRLRMPALLFVSLFLFGYLKGQNTMTSIEHIDSLKNRLRSAEDTRDRVDLLSILCTKYMYVNPDSSVFYGTQAVAEAEKSGLLAEKLFAKGLLGEPLIYVGELPKALDLALETVDEYEKLNKGKGLMKGIGPTLYNLSEIYFQLGRYDKSREYAEQMLNFDVVIDDVGVAFGHYLIARIQVENDELEEAAQSIDSALLYFTKVRQPELVNIINGSFPGLINTQAKLLIKKGKIDDALKKYLALLDQATRNGEKYHSVETHLDIAQLYQDMDSTDSAIFHASLGMRLSNEISYAQGRLRSSQLLASLYEKSDASQSLFYHKLASETQNSLYGLGNIQVLRDMVEDKEKQRRELQNAQELFIQKRRQNILLIGALGLGVLALILYWNSRRIKAVNLTLENTLSHLKDTQTQLIQSEKMASLGELTAGIAHEIQNPLNFVNNFSEVNTELIQELKEERTKNMEQRDETLENEILVDLEQNLEKISHHGKRADSIVKGMLQHSRTSTGETVPTDLNELADEYLRLAYHGLRAKDPEFNAAFETNFDLNLPKMKVVPQDIGRVLLNLINNAFQAVHEKSQSRVDGYAPKVKVASTSEGDKVLIKVVDNGLGIADNIKDKIFQPFFTTKPTGQGTGLGLSLSYDIVKAHGGELKVESEVGEGSIFTLRLPLFGMKV